MNLTIKQWKLILKESLVSDKNYEIPHSNSFRTNDN